MKICIDAGHGNTDSGAIGVGGRREKDDNLKMALDLQKRFKAIGWEVVMTRTTDTYPTLQERCDIANKAGGSDALNVEHFGAMFGISGTIMYIEE